MTSSGHLLGRGGIPVVMIVAALVPEMGIGLKGKMPWRLKNEMAYFRKVTTTTRDNEAINAVIMGRKTWQSIPEKFRPLPKRLNIVLSRSQHENDGDDAVLFCTSLDEALSKAKKYSKPVEKIFIMGGGELYNQAHNSGQVGHLLLTEIRANKEVETDTRIEFPVYGDQSTWIRQPHSALQELVGSEVEEQQLQEGDFTYGFAYFKKKECDE